MTGNFWASLPRPILALAPMEGVTDSSFRQICRQAGADVVYTEFVSAEALARSAPSALQKLTFDETERPVVAQIFGNSTESFITAARLVERLGFDGLDINLGCPARKVVSSGSGVALLRDPKYAKKLIQAALETTSLPISIKIRSSIQRERRRLTAGRNEIVTALDLIHEIHDLPIACVMVHGRSAESGREGAVDTEMIKAVKQSTNVVVLANGGIRLPADGASLLDMTHADGVGIARGAWGRPWIFTELRALLDRHQRAVPWPARRELINTHATLAFREKGRRGIFEFRKHLAHAIAGFPGASELRRQAVVVQSLDDILAITAQLPEDAVVGFPAQSA